MNVAGKMVADVCRAAAKANAKVTLKKLLPFVCSRVKVLASSKQLRLGILYLLYSQNFPKSYCFLLPVTHTYMCVSGGKKC